ncbi:MaoC domain protein dehydratase [Rhodococcus wratislaviensis]|uniref:MaoC domain protein dehydratase n=1 Tax=Rhodococcus wratislaviensis TaxID=44752 RepID=A0A402CEY4_RHOWR|nr:MULTISPECIES: MaoC/PaaZ C-terminal domain-containing protein [Rhodococcus]GCE42145.1 MaoC domain protein dehydratase [Rhodococcus wratislaviensis]
MTRPFRHGGSEEVLVDDLTRTQIVQYAGASGDFNPIHTDEAFATEIAGRKTVMAHGMLTMGLVARALSRLVDQQSIRTFGGRFKQPVWPGDTLTLRVTPGEIADAVIHMELAVTNGDGHPVFTGYATVGTE